MDACNELRKTEDAMANLSPMERCTHFQHILDEEIFITQQEVVHYYAKNAVSSVERSFSSDGGGIADSDTASLDDSVIPSDNTSSQPLQSNTVILPQQGQEISLPSIKSFLITKHIKETALSLQLYDSSVVEKGASSSMEGAASSTVPPKSSIHHSISYRIIKTPRVMALLSPSAQQADVLSHGGNLSETSLINHEKFTEAENMKEITSPTITDFSHDFCTETGPFTLQTDTSGGEIHTHAENSPLLRKGYTINSCSISKNASIPLEKPATYSNSLAPHSTTVQANTSSIYFSTPSPQTFFPCPKFSIDLHQNGQSYSSISPSPSVLFIAEEKREAALSADLSDLCALAPSPTPFQFVLASNDENSLLFPESPFLMHDPYIEPWVHSNTFTSSCKNFSNEQETDARLFPHSLNEIQQYSGESVTLSASFSLNKGGMGKCAPWAASPFASLKRYPTNATPTAPLTPIFPPKNLYALSDKYPKYTQTTSFSPIKSKESFTTCHDPLVVDEAAFYSSSSTPIVSTPPSLIEYSIPIFHIYLPTLPSLNIPAAAFHPLNIEKELTPKICPFPSDAAKRVGVSSPCSPCYGNDSLISTEIKQPYSLHKNNEEIETLSPIPISNKDTQESSLVLSNQPSLISDILSESSVNNMRHPPCFPDPADAIETSSKALSGWLSKVDEHFSHFNCSLPLKKKHNVSNPASINDWTQEVIKCLSNGYFDSRLELTAITDLRNPFKYFSSPPEAPCWAVRFKPSAAPIPSTHTFPVLLGELIGEIKQSKHMTEKHGEAIHLRFSSLIDAPSNCTITHLKKSRWFLTSKRIFNILSFLKHFAFPEYFPSLPYSVNCQLHEIYVNGWPHILVTSIPGVSIQAEDLLVTDLGYAYTKAFQIIGMQKIFAEVLHYRQVFNCIPSASSNYKKFDPLLLSKKQKTSLCKICYAIKDGNGETSLIVCDSCHNAYHALCVGYSSLEIPDEALGWFCYRCIHAAQYIIKSYKNKAAFHTAQTLFDAEILSDNPILEDNGTSLPFSIKKNTPLHTSFERLSHNVNLDEASMSSLKPCKDCYTQFKKFELSLSHMGSLCRLQFLHLDPIYNAQTSISFQANCGVLMKNLADTIWNLKFQQKETVEKLDYYKQQLRKLLDALQNTQSLPENEEAITNKENDACSSEDPLSSSVEDTSMHQFSFNQMPPPHFIPSSLRPKGIYWSRPQCGWTVQFWKRNGQEALTIVKVSESSEIPFPSTLDMESSFKTVFSNVKDAYQQAIYLRTETYKHFLRKEAAIIQCKEGIRWIGATCKYRAFHRNVSASFSALSIGVKSAYQRAAAWLKKEQQRFQGANIKRNKASIKEKPRRFSTRLHWQEAPPPLLKHPSQLLPSSTLPSIPLKVSTIEKPISTRHKKAVYSQSAYIEACQAEAKSFRPFPLGIMWAATTARWFVVYKATDADRSKRMKTFSPSVWGSVAKAFHAACEFLDSVEPWPLVSRMNRHVTPSTQASLPLKLPSLKNHSPRLEQHKHNDSPPNKAILAWINESTLSEAMKAPLRTETEKHRKRHSPSAASANSSQSSRDSSPSTSSTSSISASTKSTQGSLSQTSRCLRAISALHFSTCSSKKVANSEQHCTIKDSQPLLQFADSSHKTTKKEVSPLLEENTPIQLLSFDSGSHMTSNTMNSTHLEKISPTSPRKVKKSSRKSKMPLCLLNEAKNTPFVSSSNLLQKRIYCPPFHFSDKSSDSVDSLISPFTKKNEEKVDNLVINSQIDPFPKNCSPVTGSASVEKVPYVFSMTIDSPASQLVASDALPDSIPNTTSLSLDQDLLKERNSSEVLQNPAANLANPITFVDVVVSPNTSLSDTSLSNSSPHTIAPTDTLSPTTITSNPSFLNIVTFSTTPADTEIFDTSSNLSSHATTSIDVSYQNTPPSNNSPPNSLCLPQKALTTQSDSANPGVPENVTTENMTPVLLTSTGNSEQKEFSPLPANFLQLSKELQTSWLTQQARILHPDPSHPLIQWVIHPECGWRVSFMDAGVRSTKHLFVSRHNWDVATTYRKACWYARYDFSNSSYELTKAAVTAQPYLAPSSLPSESSILHLLTTEVSMQGTHMPNSGSSNSAFEKCVTPLTHYREVQEKALTAALRKQFSHYAATYSNIKGIEWDDLSDAQWRVYAHGITKLFRVSLLKRPAVAVNEAHHLAVDFLKAKKRLSPLSVLSIKKRRRGSDLLSDSSTRRRPYPFAKDKNGFPKKRRALSSPASRNVNHPPRGILQKSNFPLRPRPLFYHKKNCSIQSSSSSQARHSCSLQPASKCAIVPSSTSRRLSHDRGRCSRLISRKVLNPSRRSHSFSHKADLAQISHDNPSYSSCFPRHSSHNEAAVFKVQDETQVFEIPSQLDPSIQKFHHSKAKIDPNPSSSCLSSLISSTRSCASVIDPTIEGKSFASKNEYYHYLREESKRYTSNPYVSYDASRKSLIVSLPKGLRKYFGVVRRGITAAAHDVEDFLRKHIKEYASMEAGSCLQFPTSSSLEKKYSTSLPMSSCSIEKRVDEPTSSTYSSKDTKIAGITTVMTSKSRAILKSDKLIAEALAVPPVEGLSFNKEMLSFQAMASNGNSKQFDTKRRGVAYAYQRGILFLEKHRESSKAKQICSKALLCNSDNSSPLSLKMVYDDDTPYFLEPSPQFKQAEKPATIGSDDHSVDPMENSTKPLTETAVPPLANLVSPQPFNTIKASEAHSIVVKSLNSSKADDCLSPIMSSLSNSAYPSIHSPKLSSFSPHSSCSSHASSPSLLSLSTHSLHPSCAPYPLPPSANSPPPSSPPLSPLQQSLAPKSLSLYVPLASTCSASPRIPSSVVDPPNIPSPETTRYIASPFPEPPLPSLCGIQINENDTIQSNTSSEVHPIISLPAAGDVEVPSESSRSSLCRLKGCEEEIENSAPLTTEMSDDVIPPLRYSCTRPLRRCTGKKMISSEDDYVPANNSEEEEDTSEDESEISCASSDDSPPRRRREAPGYKRRRTVSFSLKPSGDPLALGPLMSSEEMLTKEDLDDQIMMISEIVQMKKREHFFTNGVGPLLT
ncbi:AP2 domain transcription factor AP2VIIa-7 [Cardiosporidium cionae]|uniref:AP2 domain transcription factor AP2VIIa-7 n=1 Tax=Cardiosporidium cionae TaxID=476202 RepID=A0ABQ7JAC4_9APIC|nr:AP2 domain transcription factor AP2VIIa-7 [Cardiosporidium cionae]|eukprot:KAF8820941.1 AP2 domain transcription factor AP2VIIa-7 [Cardiosporidium cionae]